MTQELDPQALRKVAESATPGPWSTVDANVVQVPNFPDGHWVVDCPNPSEVDHINAEFIATFDPPTVLALLSRLEQAEQAVQRLREALGNHPRTCDQYTDDDPVKCGWKRTVIDVQNALDGEPNEV